MGSSAISFGCLGLGMDYFYKNLVNTTLNGLLLPEKYSYNVPQLGKKEAVSFLCSIALLGQLF